MQKFHFQSGENVPFSPPIHPNSLSRKLEKKNQILVIAKREIKKFNKILPHMIANFNTSTEKRNNVTQFCTGPKSRLDLRGGREVKSAFFQGGRFSAFECRSKKEF